MLTTFALTLIVFTVLVTFAVIAILVRKQNPTRKDEAYQDERMTFTPKK